MYYDALKAKWATLTQTPTHEKLDAVNAPISATVDVPVSKVIAYLALQGKLAGLQAYAANPPQGAVAQAVVAAKELVTLLDLTSITIFEMSNPQTYSAIQAFLNALASDTATGVTSTDVANLLAMATTTMPWWKANNYPSPINESDLVAAGGLT